MPRQNQIQKSVPLQPPTQQTAPPLPSDIPNLEIQRRKFLFEIEAGQQVAKDQVEFLTSIVSGRKNDFDNNRLKGDDAKAYLTDSWQLTVAQQASSELHQTGRKLTFSAQTLEFIRCEIEKDDVPNQQAWMPTLPDFKGKFFRFDRAVGTEVNKQVQPELAAEAVSFDFPPQLASAKQIGHRHSETQIFREHLLQQLIEAYAAGASFISIYHGFEKAVANVPKLNLLTATFEKLKIQEAQFTNSKLFSALRQQISELFEFANFDEVSGIEPFVETANGESTRVLNTKNRHENEIDRLCSRALIEEVMHSIQTAKRKDLESVDAELQSLCLSPLTEQYLRHSADHPKKADKLTHSLDPDTARRQRLDALMEQDVLCAFIEKWRARGISLRDLAPELREFHAEVRNEVIEFLTGKDSPDRELGQELKKALNETPLGFCLAKISASPRSFSERRCA